MTTNVVTDSSNEMTTTDDKSSKNKVEAVSLAGVANSAFGNLAADFFKHVLTKEDNQAATKKDVRMLAQLMARYHRVNNLSKRFDQTIPIFDAYTGYIEYVTTNRALQLLNPSTNF